MAKFQRHVDLRLSPGEAVQRALSQVGKLKYVYGHGGVDPKADSPGPTCDCTGFTSWCHGHDRLLKGPDGEPFYVYTESLVSPKGTHGRYRHVYAPAPGDVLAYAANPKRGIPFGHAGIVTSIAPGGPAEWDPFLKECWQHVIVTHCRSPQKKAAPAVITEPAWRAFGSKWGKPKGTVITRSVHAEQ